MQPLKSNTCSHVIHKLWIWLCYNLAMFSEERCVRRWLVCGLLGLTLGLASCTPEIGVQGRGTPVAMAPVAATPAAPVGSWESVAPGLEFRELTLRANGHSGVFSIVRLDPEQYHLRVAYDKDSPGNIREWVKAIKPLAMINGGYFDDEKRATALVIFDGVAQGTSYDGFGGMLVVNPDGKFELRSLRQQPYDPSEGLQQAMQSTPMLIQPGGTLSDIQADNDVARRSVIARDRAGRILLMVNGWPSFTLPDLAVALKESDLDLDAALNLDGGRSSGLYLRRAPNDLVIEAFDRLPLMLVVDPR